jgi:outer membrane cobalamin receptor
MKKQKIFIVSTVFILFIFSSNVFAQNNTGIVIKGQVVEKSTGKPLESATIQVFKISDSSLVNGSLTDKSGNFIISDIIEGIYTVKVSYIGYGTAVAKNVKAVKNKKEINLGIVKLDVSSEFTQEIEVVDDAPLLTFEQGKKIYDVKKDLTVQNGNALDVLKNIPSVDVDNDGNVSLRGGGNVKILIDGKPSALLSNGTQILQNIPANLIEKVEIINNPSSKYDAEGISGIINIVMKQSQNVGLNGNIKVNGGTGDKYNLSTGSSLKSGKFSLNGNYSYWDYSVPGVTNFYRNNYTSTVSRSIEQVINWKYKGQSHYGSFGIDYDFDKLNTLSLAMTYFNYNRNLTFNNSMNIFDVNNVLNSSMKYLNEDGRNGWNFDATLTYTKKFEEKGRDFTTFINYSGRNEKSPTLYKSFLPSSVFQQKKDARYDFNFFNVQADYIHPFGETAKLETGLKSNARFIDGDYTFRYFDDVSGNWLPVPGRDNDAKYKDIISAFYANYSGAYKDFSYQAGLRSEHTYLDFSILNGTEKYNRSYFDVFPSFSISQKIGVENQFQLTYSRRINRPFLGLLNPFVEQFDDYTKRSGNPYLNPEYINSVELGYTRSFSFITMTLSGFFRNSKDPVNFISNVIDTNGTVLMKPENRGKSNTFGTEFILQGGFAKWWTYNGSVSYFNSNIFDNSTVNGFDKKYNAWTGRFSTNAAIPNIFDIQLNYFYFGKQMTAQGTIAPGQMLNIAIQKSFFEKKLVLGFRIQDLLDQQRFKIDVLDNNFSQKLYQKPTSRTAFLTLTFNFGENGSTKSQKNSQKKQRENESEIQNTGN